MNPLHDLERTIRVSIYVLAVAAGALTAGYAAIGDLPSWLIFANAALGTLGGGTALSNLTPDDA